jgi:hypothetical protein
MRLVRPSQILPAVIALAVLAAAAVPVAAEEASDEPTSTQLVLLHERWLAWEPDRPSVRPTDVKGPVDWLKLQLSGARSQATDWMQDGGFSLLRDRDSRGSQRFTMAAGALTTKWASFHLRARVGRPELSAGLRPRRHAPAFGVTVPWDQFTFELEAIDDKDFGYSVLSGLRWHHGDGRVQYGVALPVSVGHGPSVAAILQVLIRLDDLSER